MSNMILKTCAASAVVLALAFGAGTSAQEKKKATKAPAPKAAACSTVKDEAACKARSDCTWQAATTKLKITVRRARCVAAAPAKSTKTPSKTK